MTELVLRLDDVIVREGERTLLDVEVLTIAAGETLALIGPNGAGKTTLVHVAGLLRRPAAGTVAILGQTAISQNAATLRRALSVVFQDPLLFDVRVLANAAAGLRFQGISRRVAEARAGTWLERFGVGHLADRQARSLSGGEAARVALARAFATEPAMLLLDEPFSALDAPTRIGLLPALRQRLIETGTAAVLVSHDRDEAFAFGDRTAVMDRGRIVASGDASCLMAHPSSRQAAMLLGIETILPASVSCIDGEFAVVSPQPAGPSVRVGISSPAAIAPGENVTLTLPAGAVRALRPHEHLDQDRKRHWNLLPGTITGVTWLSVGTRLIVETPAPIVALAPWHPSDSRWAVGDHAVVAFLPESAHVIPERP